MQRKHQLVFQFVGKARHAIFGDETFVFLHLAFGYVELDIALDIGEVEVFVAVALRKAIAQELGKFVAVGIAMADPINRGSVVFVQGQRKHQFDRESFQRCLVYLLSSSVGFGSVCRHCSTERSVEVTEVETEGVNQFAGIALPAGLDRLEAVDTLEVDRVHWKIPWFGLWVELNDATVRTVISHLLHHVFLTEDVHFALNLLNGEPRVFGKLFDFGIGRTTGSRAAEFTPIETGITVSRFGPFFVNRMGQLCHFANRQFGSLHLGTPCRLSFEVNDYHRIDSIANIANTV